FVLKAALFSKSARTSNLAKGGLPPGVVLAPHPTAPRAESAAGRAKDPSRFMGFPRVSVPGRRTIPRPRRALRDGLGLLSSMSVRGRSFELTFDEGSWPD